jgi:nitroreductase
VLICGDLKLEAYQGNWTSDCAAATQNLLLATHDRGLGAVWSGVHPNPQRVAAFQQSLGLPENVIPLALVPIGHPMVPTPQEDRFEPAKVHRNHW